MKKIIAVIALASSMGVAYANEPVALSDSQMDNVSAGGYAFGDAFAQAFGALASATATNVLTLVSVVGQYETQGGMITVDRAQSWSSSEAVANFGQIQLPTQP